MHPDLQVSTPLARPVSRRQPRDLLWGHYAFTRFSTPRLSSYRSPDHDAQAERARFHLRRAKPHVFYSADYRVQAYEFMPDGEVAPRASVLMLHGWTGEASFMCAFAEHFRRRGFRVVLVDFPAHGASSGRRTTLMACAQAARDAAERLGPFQYVVGHSLGGTAALLAGEGAPPIGSAYPFQAYVLIAVPNRFADVTRKFGAELSLNAAAQWDFERRLEAIAQRRLYDFTGAKLAKAVARPAVLFHARDDGDVPHGDGEAIVRAVPHLEFRSVDGLGHRNILYATPVVRGAADFLLGLRTNGAG